MRTINAKCWLWPDHNIGKRESGQLRDEHNAAVNDLHNALTILDKIIRRATTPLSDGGIAWDDVERARELIARATGEKVEA